MNLDWDNLKQELVEDFVESVIKEGRELGVEFDTEYVAKLRTYGLAIGNIWVSHQMELHKRHKENTLP